MITGPSNAFQASTEVEFTLNAPLDQQVCRRGIGILQIGKAGPCQRLQSWIRQRRARLELALRELRRRREEVAIPEVIV